MRQAFQYTVRAAAGVALLLLAAPAFAGQGGAGATVARDPGQVQIAGQMGAQTANMPVGTIRLRVIPKIGAKAIREQIKWIVKTFGRDGSGKRQTVAEATGPTPELVLPAGWYVVHAQLRDKLIRHPVEVTAGRTFKYTLVKQ